jgi:hypothetical protein
MLDVHPISARLAACRGGRTCLNYGAWRSLDGQSLTQRYPEQELPPALWRMAGARPVVWTPA